MMSKVLHPQEGGAFTSVFAACSPRDTPEITHGSYIKPPNVVGRQAPAAYDEANQQRLFEFTEALLKELEV